jgi:transglutaminase-like putative cysteine protease
VRLLVLARVRAQMKHQERTTALLLGVLALAAAPHVAHLPVVVPALFFLILAWRALVLVGRAPLPGRWLRVVLALSAVALVLGLFGSALGRNPGVALLLLLTGLKLLELERHRDVMVAVSLGYFLTVTNFLFQQGLGMAVYLFAVALLLISVQIAANQGSGALSAAGRLRLSVALAVQALPIVAVLFVLFPRIEGPLWSLPKDAYGGLTGLDDEMEPGAVTRLAQSDEVAFRVRFQGSVPPQDALYWRGPVLTRTDGRRWSPLRRKRVPAVLEGLARPVTYTVTLEPHNRRWLFGLDLVAPREGDAGGQRVGTLDADHVLRAARRVRSRMRYALTSYLEYRWFGLDPAEREAALQLPRRANPRTRALARDWRREDPAPRALVARALDHFAREPFYYTLSPPALGAQPMDDFLFRTRRGFCEHYASAFVTLMRAAGVPARVVTGYQGGEHNPVGDYLIVRQLNAHAWAEVWLPERGWQRVDATAAVPPQRVELSAQSLLGRPALAQRLGVPPPDLVRRLVHNLGRGLDAIDNAWNQWVLGYGQETQRQVLDRLGLGTLSWTGIGLVMVASTLALVLAVAARLLWSGARARDPVLADYRRFCRRLARRGLARAPHESPSAYARRVVAARPDLAGRVALVTRLYLRLRYGPRPSQAWARRLHRLVVGFRP